jgi:hypothetical protein
LVQCNSVQFLQNKLNQAGPVSINLCYKLHKMQNTEVTSHGKDK